MLYLRYSNNVIFLIHTYCKHTRLQAKTAPVKKSSALYTSDTFYMFNSCIFVTIDYESIKHDQLHRRKSTSVKKSEQIQPHSNSLG